MNLASLSLNDLANLPLNPPTAGTVSATITVANTSGNPVSGATVYYQMMQPPYTSLVYNNAIQSTVSNSEGVASFTALQGAYYQYWLDSSPHTTVFIPADADSPYPLTPSLYT